MIVAFGIETLEANKLGKARFKSRNLIKMCASLSTVDNLHRLIPILDQTVEQSNITKEEFMNEYFFRLSCTATDPLTHAMLTDWSIALKLYEYGMNFEHPIEDLDGYTTTMRDFALHKFKTTSGGVKQKWRRVLRFVKKNKIRGCKELRLECTAPY